TALRGTELYSATHPLVQRGIDGLAAAATEALQAAPTVVIGFVGDEVIVDTTRLPRGTAALVGFARDLREREIEKVTLSRGLTREELRGFIGFLADRQSTGPIADRLAAKGVRHVALGKVVVEESSDDRVGIAALMHDIGKVNTPLEVLNEPDKLTKDEFEIMKRHVVDGAHILRRTPEMPALAPIVAFEHHLKQDLSGYPEKIGSRQLNLCTMIVSIADVFDALRSNRPYRQGLATNRIRAIMGEQGNPAFNQTLLKRFVNLMGLFPVGNLVPLSTEELAVVTAEHP